MKKCCLCEKSVKTKLGLFHSTTNDETRITLGNFVTDFERFPRLIKIEGQKLENPPLHFVLFSIVFNAESECITKTNLAIDSHSFNADSCRSQVILVGKLGLANWILIDFSVNRLFQGHFTPCFLLLRKTYDSSFPKGDQGCFVWFFSVNVTWSFDKRNFRSCKWIIFSSTETFLDTDLTSTFRFLLSWDNLRGVVYFVSEFFLCQRSFYSGFSGIVNQIVCS